MAFVVGVPRFGPAPYPEGRAEFTLAKGDQMLGRVRTRYVSWINWAYRSMRHEIVLVPVVENSRLDPENVMRMDSIAKFV